MRPSALATTLRAVRLFAVVAFALMALPPAAAAQGAEALAGEWRNPSTTRGIVGARVYSQNARWMVQILGRCQPTPCVWDPLPLTAEKVSGPPRATATFSRSNMRRQIMLRLGEDSLVVTIASHQLAVPARGIEERRYTTTDELTFVKARTEPLPPMQRRR